MQQAGGGHAGGAGAAAAAAAAAMTAGAPAARAARRRTACPGRGSTLSSVRLFLARPPRAPAPDPDLRFDIFVDDDMAEGATAVPDP